MRAPDHFSPRSSSPLASKMVSRRVRRPLDVSGAPGAVACAISHERSKHLRRSCRRARWSRSVSTRRANPPCSSEVLASPRLTAPPKAKKLPRVTNLYLDTRPPLIDDRRRMFPDLPGRSVGKNRVGDSTGEEDGTRNERPEYRAYGTRGAPPSSARSELRGKSRKPPILAFVELGLSASCHVTWSCHVAHRGS